MTPEAIAPPPCSSRNEAPTQLPVLPLVPITLPHLPASRAEMDARGWDAVDVVFVTGDAYVDHPAFAMGILGRVLEAAGFRVAILSQPDWKSADAWRQFGRPRLFFGVSAGNMDSMINHYTANKKVRNDDAYSPGGRINLRPDRATIPYCHRAREAFPGVPIIAGGVEASLRRLAHYDYWSDTVKRSILLDSKADLVVFGMGEQQIVEIARRLKAGESAKDLRDMRGVAYAMGASETPPQDALVLPTYDDVKTDKLRFVEATKRIHLETNPLNAKRLVQYHDRQAVVVNPPALPISQEDMDRVYGLSYTRRPHPMYKGERIPAYEVVKDSVTIMRGCFGGCTFCSITAHQGRIIQSRSQESILGELRQMGQDPKFSGVVSDIGGPTANMYEMRCTKPEVEAKCKRLSCVHPKVCKLLGTDHGPLIELMKKSRETPGVKKVHVASGIRMDLAQKSPEYLEELAMHHVGGLLKVAPEHTDPNVLKLMKKPNSEDYEGFAEAFQEASRKAGKKQFLVPYYIASHPGSDLNAMIDLAVFLKRNGYRPDQVQDFIPAPFDIATCMYYTGLDPFTGEEVYVAQHLRDRKLQRALLQYFRPENYFEVRKALLQAGRADLIGGGCDALIPDQPPRAAVQARQAEARRSLGEGRYVHQVDAEGPAKPPAAPRAQPAPDTRPAAKPGPGYRPHRRTAQKRKPR
ncbi:YgiQ family radical SAM protein [Paludisphaera mucosa]|uniref:YgiQ family radical SAM protein n=1 Tax=Paludisphaera mucosa TaxID=3030827 RepID=A0ABT6F9V3_9BACT|nr:YgiQ family radical SAM protein [Paludisphaera mucosa]MDG3004256.1 YgiQ family radical SAM protein [Paludisphaera mucosa]